MTPLDLLKILTVPGTDDPVFPRLLLTANGQPFKGWYEDLKGNVVGRINEFRSEFCHFEPVSDLERRLYAEGPREAFVAKSSFVSIHDDRFHWTGNVIEVETYLKGFDNLFESESMTFESKSKQVDICFLAHGWSGIVAVNVDNETHELDLFQQEIGLRRVFKIENKTGKTLSITVRPTGKRNANGQGTQVLIDGVIEYHDDMVVPAYAKHPARNRGGDFMGRFFEILSGLPSDAVVLDVGGGKRQIDDPRYINLEYAQLEEPDLIGDGTKLPFRNRSVDFVYTAAVLEHVKDPMAMGNEIFRVLKPGGVVLAGAAFMQPVHGEGQHFFNLTPYGIDLVFEKFSNRRVWWSNDISFTIEWILKEAKVTDLLERDELTEFLRIAKKINANIPYDRAMYFAAGVWLEGVKL